MVSRAGVAAFTCLALIAFASNSLLTRFALGSAQIDAARFTAIRLWAGAIALAVLVRLRSGTWTTPRRRHPIGPLALFAYAATFSFAYLRIGAAVGALVMFGVVQLTMIGYGILRGERPSAAAWLGCALASAGMLILTFPSVARPDWLGLLLMTIAGLAWGIYSLAGRNAPDALSDNARSFFWSSVLSIPLVVLGSSGPRATGWGIVLAVISGAVTSGFGYALWYHALTRLSVTQAAVSQLSVPVIAAAGAAALLHERVTPRLITAGVAVIAGVALVMLTRDGRN